MSKKILKADFVFGYVIRDVNLLYWNKRIAAMKKGKKMERYKVILVDDEAEVIDMIEKKIHWNDLGFEVAGSATNGVKALELVEKLQPDVVLTDIKMPYMDGLELARKLNQDYPNIYIMLCTGFDEFEYAKEAVHLEIKEYMLKPISATELSDSLVKLKNTLDKEREEKLNVKKLEDYFQEVGSQKSLIRKRSRARRKQGHANQKKEYLNWSWNYVKFCASKIELEKYYLDNKEYIINLYKNKDYPALEKVFVPYTKAMVKSLKNDEVFIPDEELQHIYLDMLGVAGRTNLKKKVEKFWK